VVNRLACGKVGKKESDENKGGFNVAEREKGERTRPLKRQKKKTHKCSDRKGGRQNTLSARTCKREPVGHVKLNEDLELEVHGGGRGAHRVERGKGGPCDHGKKKGL